MDVNISFFKCNKELLVLGLRIDLDYPEDSFIRYSTENISKDCFLAKYFMIFLSTLHLGKEDGS